MKISVIIPMLNVASFLRECIDSLLNQTRKPDEIILIDDHSSDDTVRIAKEYTALNPDLIKLICFDTNKGAPAARNAGLRLAQGDFIQLLDADDFLLPEKLVHQEKMIAGSVGAVDFIAGAYCRISVNGQQRKIEVKDENDWLSLFTSAIGCTCSNLWKRSSLEAINGFDETLRSSQEYGLMFALLRNGAKVVYDDQALTMVRDRLPGQSISRKSPKDNWQQYILLRGETLEYIKQNVNLSEAELVRLQQSLFEAVRILYNFSSERSIELYNRFIPAEFKPQPSLAISASYCKLYRLFGFKATERIRSVFRIVKGKIKE